MNEQIKELMRLALESGASAAGNVLAKDIVLRQDLADMCESPRCPSYGRSASCPPHVGGPGAFEEYIKEGDHALVIRLDAPEDVVLSSQRAEIYQILHEMASSLARAARENGFGETRAFAGGSCKTIFCSNKKDCRVVDQGRACRNPGLACASMSGFGVDVARLAKSAGWEGPEKWKSNGTGIIPLYALVLLGRR